jgi:sugar/nucleoside kinase (ribokinase family)
MNEKNHDRVNTMPLTRRAADFLVAQTPSLVTHHAVLGLDGFVDSIIRVVDKRESKEKFSTVPTLTAFAERIARAAGKSTNIELWVERVKLGGNGPIMANALAAFGVEVAYIGNVGYPHLHPAFAELARRATVLSVAEPATTDALEFDDGKLMLGKRTPLLDLTWDNLVARIGRDRLLEVLTDAELIGLQNWTMIPAANGIWQHVLDEVGAHPPATGRRTAFFDLADPESRAADDIRAALELIGQFRSRFDAYLGLNEKESFAVGEVLGYRGPTAGEEAVRGVARFIHERLQIAGVVVHPRAYAVAASADEIVQVAGPFVEKPLISTGAGDHFNAGFCLGKLIGADNEIALQLGVGTSGYYVRTGQSPAAAELAEFLRSL